MNYVAITLVGLAADFAFALFIAGIIRAGRGAELAPALARPRCFSDFASVDPPSIRGGRRFFAESPYFVVRAKERVNLSSEAVALSFDSRLRRGSG